MTSWIPDVSGYSGPKYQAIAEALTDAVKSGALSPGDRLPPQRDLAAQLGLNLTTITRAYDVARQRGLIDGRGKAGSFVRDTARASVSASQQVDTGLNTPPVPASGLLQAAMSESFAELAQREDGTLFQYQGTGGDSAHRRAGADLIARMGLAANFDQIVLTAGGQNALHAIAAAALRPGARVACGAFVYPGFRALAKRMGFDLVPLPAMTGDALEQVCLCGPLDALYVVPTNDNPTGATIPATERESIAAVALRHRLQIIEDDAYGMLPDRPLAPIASHAPQQSWYIQSTSKSISPALRLAFVRAPSVADALRLSAEVHDTAVMAPPVNAAMVTMWLRDGTLDRLIEAVRGEAQWRMRLARNILGDHAFEGHQQGYHLWLKLPEGQQAAALSDKLSLAGIGAIPSQRFAVGAEPYQALRVSLGGVASPAALESALRLLGAHLTMQDEMHANLI